MIHTVKGGESLSQILKNYGVSSYASPSTWALIKTKSGSPSLIRPGEQLDLSSVAHLMSGYQAPGTSGSAGGSSGGYSTATGLTQGATEGLSPGRSFEKDYGTDANFTGLVPYAAFRQFAAEQTAPEALRSASDMMRNYDLGRIGTGSTARASGYEEYMRSQLLNDIDRMQKEMAEPYYQAAMDRYTDWLASQKKSYETDPSYQLQNYVDPNYPGMNFQVQKGLDQSVYNPHNLSQYFSSGYSAPVDWNKLYGTIT